METTISSLLTSYENGKLTRRELIKAMGMLATLGGTAGVAQAQSAPAGGFVGSAVEHISIFVTDPKRSQEFYQKTFGLSFINDNDGGIRLGPGRSMIVLRPNSRPGLDHFTIGIDKASKESVIKDLVQRGATPKEGGEANLHVKDPDGLTVEIVANDRTWK